MNQKTLKIISLVLLFPLLLLSCSQVVNEEPAIQEMVRTPIAMSRFTIQADPDLENALSILYQAFYPDESATFQAEGGDLIATGASESTDVRPGIQATFLPGSVLLSKSDMDEIAKFIEFAISADGQQALINAGELPELVMITDQAGNQIEVQQPVRRVISAYGPATSFIYSVGAMNRLVSASFLGARDPMGAAAMERIDPRFSEIIGDDSFSQQDFNVEEAAKLNPDLIITSSRSAWLDVVQQLDIPVILIDAETPERLIEAMQLTGQLFGPHTSAQASAWIKYYDGITTAIKQDIGTIPPEERPRVLFTGTSPLRIASGEMYQTDVIEAAGGVSVSTELSGYWNDVNLEQVAIWDPEVIIVPPYGGASVEAITEDPEWQILDAVNANLVFRMPKLVVPWDTPAPDSILGIIWMAQRLHPEVVGLDCVDEADYFYNTFYQYAITVEELASICSVD